MNDQKTVNSEKYWDTRFKQDWDENSGDKQSIFFMNLANEMFPKWFKELLRQGDKSILDWGCAEGDGSNVLAELYPNCKIEGMDFAESAIKNAESRHGTANLKFTAKDILTSNHDQKYNIVLSSNVFEHFHDPWTVFNKVSSYATDLFVMMVPFEEGADNLIPEHFHSFSANEFLLAGSKWNIVHFEVRDTATVENTYWGGQQVLVIFSTKDFIEKNNLTVNQVIINGEVDGGILGERVRIYQNTNTQLRRKIEEQTATISQLTKETQDLRVHVNELWTHLHSKHFILADRLYSGLSRIAPRGTVRRRVGMMPIRAALYVKNTPSRKLQRQKEEFKKQFKEELLSASNSYESVIIYISMPWDNIMRQRPHHIAEQLATRGHLVVYMDYEADMPRRISENLVVVDGTWCFDLLKESSARKYFMLPAGYNMPFDDVMSVVNKGYSLIYEYIDELDETISGDLTNQVEVFKRLEELKPSLLIASAKRLHEDLGRRFNEKQIVMSANAVDVAHFDMTTKRYKKDAPIDLKPILDLGKPIVGYYGAIAPWLDYDLINELTYKYRDEISFIFIGVDYNGGLKNLVTYDNVFYLGPKDYNDLPNYSYWFDAAVIPFQKGDIAKSTSPVKLFEYMAMGLPTICTSDLRECEGYDHVYMSKDVAEFDRNMIKAIEQKKRSSSRKVLAKQAQANTWAARAEVISNQISKSSEK